MSCIPAKIAEVYELLDIEVRWLHGRWICCRQLFAESEQRIDMLNECAGTFFMVVQDVLLDEVLLTLTKFTDPAGRGETSRLSFEQLQRRLDAYANHQLAMLNRATLDRLHGQCAAFKDWRDNRLAHFNLATMQSKTVSLPPVSRQMIDDSLETIRVYMNAIPMHYDNTEIGYEQFIMQNDGDALLAVLRHGLRYEELLQADTLSYDDLQKGKWSNA